MDKTFKGAAKRIAHPDIARIGAMISVGEDEMHAFVASHRGAQSLDKPVTA